MLNEQFKRKWSSLVFASIIFFFVGCNQEHVDIPCDLVSDPNPVFTVSFTDLNSLHHIEPIGEILPLHIYSDHAYVVRKSDVDSVPIYAPIDMALVNVVADPLDYALHFKISQEVELVFGHISDPIDQIKQLAKNQGIPFFRCENKPLLYVTAGQLLGWSKNGLVFDLGVYNSTQKMNFINPERFRTFIKEFHASCPFDYYTPVLKTQMYDLFGPKPLMQPLSCRDSRDKIGTIAGSWFDTQEISITQDFTTFSPLLIAASLDGNIRIVRGNQDVIHRVFIYDASYKDPETVTTEHCYEVSTGGYFYFQMQGDGSVRIVRETSGSCPGNFPSSGYITYYR